jgi:hypothetical protein
LSTISHAVIFSSDDSSVLKNVQNAGIGTILHHPPFPAHKISIVDYHLSLLNRVFDNQSYLTLKNGAVPGCHSDLATTWVIHPGSGSKKKNWPFKNFLQISSYIQNHGMKVLWVLGPADESIKPPSREPVLKNPALTDLAIILSCCKRYIGNDSGISHLAAATGCQSIVLFGPSDPIVWAPRGPRVKVLRSPEEEIDRLSVEDVVTYSEW